MVYLIITSKQKIQNIYGTLICNQIFEALNTYISSVQAKNISTSLLLLEDKIQEDNFSCINIKSAIKQYHQRENKINNIMFVGGDNIVPFYRLVDNSDWPEFDNTILSDTYYVDFEQKLNYHQPEIGIGRLPDGGSDSGELLILQLQNSAKNHNCGGIFLTNKTGFACAKWENSSRATYTRLDQSLTNLHWCPPKRIKANKQKNKIQQTLFPSEGSLYVNLHGSPNDAYWWGDQKSNSFSLNSWEDLTVMNYQLLTSIPLKNYIIFCAACYGAAIDGNRAPLNSLALCALKQGSAAFFGATERTYSVETQKNQYDTASGIDKLFHDLIYEVFHKKSSFGDALCEAKRRYFAQSSTDSKNLLGLSLLGDPIQKFNFIQ